MRNIFAGILAMLMVASAGVYIGYNLGILDIYRNAGFYIDGEMLVIELHGDWNEVYYEESEGWK